VKPAREVAFELFGRWRRLSDEEIKILGLKA